jgi:hypothetical protein
MPRKTAGGKGSGLAATGSGGMIGTLLSGLVQRVSDPDTKALVLLFLPAVTAIVTTATHQVSVSVNTWREQRAQDAEDARKAAKKRKEEAEARLQQEQEVADERRQRAEELRKRQEFVQYTENAIRTQIANAKTPEEQARYEEQLRLVHAKVVDTAIDELDKVLTVKKKKPKTAATATGNG